MQFGLHVVNLLQPVLEIWYKSRIQIPWRGYIPSNLLGTSNEVTSPLLFHLMGTSLPVVSSEGFGLLLFFLPTPVLTPTPRRQQYMEEIFIWDIKTGVVITEIDSWKSCEIAFSGNSKTITLMEEDGTLHMCNALDGTSTYKEGLVPSSHFLAGAHCINKESLWFSICFEKDGEHVVNIQELQQSSDPLHPLIKSFPVPSYKGEFSFSPVSFHGSFVTELEITILDLRDSRILLQAEANYSPYTPPGCFSPDGSFFACGTEEDEIYLWRNISGNYIPWRNLQPRLPFKGFSFSPTTSTILTWGQEGIQLLEHGNHSTSLSPSKLKSYWPDRNHLVAYSIDSPYIATAQQDGSVVTVLDSLSTTKHLCFDTYMQILDIKIVGNVIFVVDGHKLASWHLGTGEPAYDDKITAISASTLYSSLTLSNDCSKVAFADEDTVSLYDIQTQRILCSYTARYPIEDIQFSPNGSQLWFLTYIDDCSPYVVKLERGKGGNFENVTEEHTDDACFDGWQSWVNPFSPHGFCIQGKPEWVTDQGGSKLLWLPLSWRPKQFVDVRWNSNCLVFVSSDHPDPIIVEFQP